MSRVPGSGPDFRLHLFTEQLQTTASDFYTHYFIGVSAYVMISGNFIQISHYVRSVQIRSFSVPYFPAFGLNTDQKNSVLGHFPRSFHHLKTILKKCPPNFIDFCIKSFPNKLYAPKVIVQDAPKRDVLSS